MNPCHYDYDTLYPKGIMPLYSNIQEQISKDTSKIIVFLQKRIKELLKK